MKAFILLLLLSLQAAPARPQDVGVIAGVIRSSEGTAAAGVRVFARSTSNVSEDQNVLEAQTETDASGRYRLEIAPGQYHVGTGFLDAPTWYPATADIKTARAVMVSSNATLSLDITALPTSTIPGNIQVQIFSATSGLPIEGVTVSLSGIIAPAPMRPGQRMPSVPRQARTVNAQTDANGNAAFRNVEPGRYSVQPRFMGFVIPDSSSVVIDGAHVSQQVQITMTPNGSISGRLLGADGKPLSRATVWASAMQYADGRRRLAMRIRAQTDEQGAYHLAPLEPGPYYVIAEAAALRLGLGSTYYPGTTNLKDATAVAVGNAEHLAGIDFKTLDVKTYSASGRVANINGTRITRFNLAPHDDATADPPRSIDIGNDALGLDGSFTLSGIPPGSWDLFVAAPASVRASGHIEVIDRDLQGVTIAQNALSEVRGRIVMPDGTPVVPQFVATLVARDRRPGNAVDVYAQSQRIRNGAFAFAQVTPGRYSIRFSGIPIDFHVDGIRVGSRDVSETGVFEVGTGAMEPVEIRLAQGGASFRGFFNVTLAYMTPDQLRNVRVTIVPSGARRSNHALYQTIRIPRAGEPFSFSGVVPGDYKVFAWSRLPEDAEKSPEFLKRYEEFGAAVHVTEGRVDDIQVSLIPMP